MDSDIRTERHKGRGAFSNRSGRFERETRERVDDGWDGPAHDPDDAPSAPATVLAADATRTIVTRNTSPDVGFRLSVNPYRGCEHGCIYCFARPTHAFLGLSPGLDFETRIFHKPDAPALLRAELGRRGYVPETIALGANTDPYQPVERKLMLTRRILEVLAECRHPVGIITKSALVTRDIDLLSRMAEDGLVLVCVSVTTLDRRLAGAMEPRAAAPHRRLEAIRALSAAGVPVAVLSSPIIPGLNDHEIEAILEAAAAAGAKCANYVLLRLPLEIKELFEEWLRGHVPDRAERVLSLIRQCRDGALYQSEFGTRMKGTGVLAQLVARRFDLACRRLGLGRRHWRLNTARFRPPARDGQLDLF